MDILAWVAVGIGAGLLAQFILRDKWAGGIVGNLVLGAMGAVVAGWVMMRLFAPGSAPRVDIGNLIFAFLGAAGLLWAGRLVAAKKVRRHHLRASGTTRRGPGPKVSAAPEAVAKAPRARARGRTPTPGP